MSGIFISDDIKVIIDKYKHTIKAVDYDQLLRLLDEVKKTQGELIRQNEKIPHEKIPPLAEELQKAEARIKELEGNPQYIHCIKCNQSMGHDSRGWMRIIDNSDCVNNPEGSAKIIWLCPKCIMESQAVKDYIENGCGDAEPHSTAPKGRL